MDRRALDDDVYALVAPALEERGFLAAFTERTGGASRGRWASLNLAFHTGDRLDAVRENRRRVVDLLSIDPFATAAQVHGARVVRVGAKRAGAGFLDPEGVVPEADVLAVSRRLLPVAVLVADCVPLALAAPAEGLMLAVHAGWRGLASGVVQEAVAAFEGAKPILAAMGPAIGPCHYEVGDDVALAVASGSDAGAVTVRRDGKLFLDLPGTVARILRRAGVRRIDRAEECTACHEERFFSHRRDGETGRQALVAVRLS